MEGQGGRDQIERGRRHSKGIIKRGTWWRKRQIQRKRIEGSWIKRVLKGHPSEVRKRHIQFSECLFQIKVEFHLRNLEIHRRLLLLCEIEEVVLVLGVLVGLLEVDLLL